jgi:hypothetical protein
MLMVKQEIELTVRSIKQRNCYLMTGWRKQIIGRMWAINYGAV